VHVTLSHMKLVSCLIYGIIELYYITRQLETRVLASNNNFADQRYLGLLDNNIVRVRRTQMTTECTVTATTIAGRVTVWL